VHFFFPCKKRTERESGPTTIKLANFRVLLNLKKCVRVGAREGRKAGPLFFKEQRLPTFFCIFFASLHPENADQDKVIIL